MLRTSVVALAACSPVAGEVDGARLRLSDARATLDEPDDEGLRSVLLEVRGEWGEEPVCLVFAGSGERGEDRWIVTPYAWIVDGDPGLLLGWVHPGTCPAVASSEGAVWRLRDGDLRFGDESLAIQVEVRDLVSDALVGVLDDHRVPWRD